MRFARRDGDESIWICHWMLNDICLLFCCSRANAMAALEAKMELKWRLCETAKGVRRSDMHPFEFYFIQSVHCHSIDTIYCSRQTHVDISHPIVFMARNTHEFGNSLFSFYSWMTRNAFCVGSSGSRSRQDVSTRIVGTQLTLCLLFITVFNAPNLAVLCLPFHGKQSCTSARREQVSLVSFWFRQ